MNDNLNMTFAGQIRREMKHTLDQRHLGALAEKRLPTPLTVETVRMKGMLVSGCNDVPLDVFAATGASGSPALSVILKNCNLCDKKKDP